MKLHHKSTNNGEMPSSKVLVYHYRANDHPVVRNGVAVISKQELEDILAREPNLQATQKPIHRSAKVVTVYQHDLSTNTFNRQHPTRPNRDANVAAVQVPYKVWIENLLTGKFTVLVILSMKC